MSKYGVFSAPYFPAFGKYGPEKTPYLDTFHIVKVFLTPLSDLIKTPQQLNFNENEYKENEGVGASRKCKCRY